MKNEGEKSRGEGDDEPCYRCPVTCHRTLQVKDSASISRGIYIYIYLS